jgi:hypothetical protein
MRKPDLSRLSFSAGVPTMIVPPGTQIQVDPQGQVSIRTPGNLVLQNSGAYGVLESVSGSIRVEPSVHVEAVTVRCADTCFVQGRLTAWRVVARTLHVDGDAEAHVVMQETEHLEVGRNGRLVGNFRSEKELFGLFSRFSQHVRALPAPGSSQEGAGAPHEGAALETEPGVLTPEAIVEAEIEAVDVASAGAPPRNGAGPAADAGAAWAPPDLPDALCLALLLLDQVASEERWSAAERRVGDRLRRLLREGDLDTLRHTYKTLFARLGDGEPLRRARRLVGGHFDAEASASRGGGGGSAAVPGGVPGAD